ARSTAALSAGCGVPWRGAAVGGTPSVSREVCMVARNGRVATPRRYSRQHEKRQVERPGGPGLTHGTADDGRLGRGGAWRGDGHFVIDLRPRVSPRPAIDLHAAAHGVSRAARAKAAGADLLQLLRQVLHQLLRSSGRWLWQALAPVAGWTRRTAQRQGRR